MMRKILVALGLLLASPAAAQVPFYPQTLPANTVVGRIGIGAGPSAAIPFNTFISTAFANSPITINGVQCPIGGSCTISGGGGGGTPGGTNGQVQFNSSGSFGGFAVGGDGTLNTSNGQLIVTKTNGAPFASSATTDATNASNIASGTLPAARLPVPSASTLGGIESITCASNTWVNVISTLGVPTCAQPAFSNLSGSATPAQLPAATSGAAGTVPASGGGTTNFLRADFAWAAPGGAGSPGGTSGQVQYNSSGSFAGFTLSGDCTLVTSTGVVTCTKTNGSVFVASATTDATNASNIASGSLALGRIATMANNTVLGNVSGSTAVPVALTATQHTTLCNVATSSLSGCVPSSGGGTTNFLRADFTWAVPPGSGGGTPGGSSGQIQYNNAGAFAGFTMSGDATLVTSTGAITVTKTSGSAFAASATTDTTSASNISSGSLALGRIATIANNTVLGNVSGSTAVPVALTATQLTTVCNLATSSLKGCAPASGGGTSNFLRADFTWAAPTTSSSCPPGYQCVSTAGSFATALSNLNAAGRGTLYVDQDVSVSTVQNVTATFARITCRDWWSSNIATTSTSADLLNVSSFSFEIVNCGLSFAGTPGAKTAGALLHNGATYSTMVSVYFSPDCFICLQLDNANGVYAGTNLLFSGNTAVPHASAANIYINTNIVTLSNVTTLNVASTSFAPSYGVLILGCACSFTNINLIQQSFAIYMAAQSGGIAANNWLKLSDSYLDNCLTTCLEIAPFTGGATGYVEVTNTEIGTAASNGSGVDITTANGGTLGSIKLNNNEIFAYTSNVAASVTLTGTAGLLSVQGNSLGFNEHAVGIAINSGTGTHFIASGNNFAVTSHSIVITPTLTLAPAIQGNLLNSKTNTLNSNTTTYVVNNVP